MSMRSFRIDELFACVTFCALGARAMYAPTTWALLGLTVLTVFVLSLILIEGFLELKNNCLSARLAIGLAGSLAFCNQPLAGINVVGEEMFYFIHPSEKPTSTMAVNAMRDNFIEVFGLVAVVTIGLMVGLSVLACDYVYRRRNGGMEMQRESGLLETHDH